MMDEKGRGLWTSIYAVKVLINPARVSCRYPSEYSLDLVACPSNNR